MKKRILPEQQVAGPVTINMPETTSPVLHVQVPEMAPPPVHVNVPEQKQPIVNVSPIIERGEGGGLKQFEVEVTERDNRGLIKKMTLTEMSNG